MFEPKGNDCFLAFWTTPRKGSAATRAIKEGAGWRADKTVAIAGAWMPWEPITSEAFPNPEQAISACRIEANAEAWVDA